MNTVVLDVCHDFLAVAVIFGRFCLKSAQWSFSDANLALKLMAAFNAMRLTLRLLYNLSWLFIHIFLQFDNFFLIFMAFWSYMNTLGVARLCFILHLLHSLPLTVSCFSKIQIGFTFLVPAHPGSPGKRAVKRGFFYWFTFTVQPNSDFVGNKYLWIVNAVIYIVIFRRSYSDFAHFYHDFLTALVMGVFTDVLSYLDMAKNTTLKMQQHTSTVTTYLSFKEILGTFNTFGIDIHLTHMSVHLHETIVLQLARCCFTEYQQKLKTNNYSFHFV